MKKFVAAIIAVAVLVPMFAMSVFAAEPPKMFAKAGAATIDGVISEGEYGEAVVINGDNAITWTGGTLETEVSYYFAWTEEALYVATSIPSAAVDTGLTLQVNFNPGNLIPDGYPGLFFGMNYGGEESLEVTQHNHGTKLAESLNEGAVADITESVEAIAKEDGTNTIFEVAIPVDFFKVTSLEGVSFEDFTLSETTVLSASPFMVLNGHGYTITGVDNMEGNSWTVKDLNLGTDRKSVV